MKYNYQTTIQSEQQTKQLAQMLAKKLPLGRSNQAFKIYLSGHLGAGKTTFTRYLLASLGYQELIKSPTYSLIESYKIKLEGFRDSFFVHHMDLYRINSIEELELLDYKACFENDSLVIIEWADNYLDQLLKPDMSIEFIYDIQLNSQKDFQKDYQSDSFQKELAGETQQNEKRQVVIQSESFQFQPNLND